MAEGRRLSSAAALAAEGLIPPERLAELAPVAARYAVAVTPAMAALIAAGAEGIGRQFLPDPAELAARPEERIDPIGDRPHSPLPGLVHRYPDRVLLMPTLTCAVYCRFCFRRETVGPGFAGLTASELSAAIDYIRADPAIWEVILTGGDPLVLAPRRLDDLLQRLDGIDHIEVIRLHTRVPAVDPERITPELVSALRRRAAVYVVLHANHPDELTPAAREACARLVDAGIPMLSQTVLLRGVNDDARVLTRLMRALVASRIKPYYLHHLDLAPGTGHFRLPIAEGQAVVADLHRQASGLCQPTYVLDVPGGYGKVPVGQAYVVQDPAGGCLIRDPNGNSHHYPDQIGPKCPGENVGI